MAKQTGSISREDQEWGTRLITRPFTSADHSTMEISVEITKPRAGRGAEITTRFSSVPISHPLKATDTTIWMNSMASILEDARKIGQAMKEKAAKK
jgi:hypothetical protein